MDKLYKGVLIIGICAVLARCYAVAKIIAMIVGGQYFIFELIVNIVGVLFAVICLFGALILIRVIKEVCCEE